jgi:hypothetical protein
MYLGDGYIVRYPGTSVLRIYLHREQREIASRVRHAIATLVPWHRVGTNPHHGASVVLHCYCHAWPELFPQHGPGRKHRRPIVLEPWQRDIVERHPWDFIRGCLESDGCRHRRIVNGKDYPAYAFTNHSTDILRLFMETCWRVGIGARQANRVRVSIARRADVARVDAMLEIQGGSISR